MAAASSHYTCRYPASVNRQNVRVVFEFIFSVSYPLFFFFFPFSFLIPNVSRNYNIAFLV